MRDKIEIKEKLEATQALINVEIKNIPTTNDEKIVSRWITKLGTLNGIEQTLKWVLEDGEKVDISPEIRQQNTINAKNYLNKIKNEQD